MELAREIDLFSQVSTVSIKNYHDKVVVDLQPHLQELLETATAISDSTTISASEVGLASEIKASSSILHLSSSSTSLKTSGRGLTVKEPPLEVVIERPLDERSLVNLSRLLGEHTPASMSQEEATSLMALLGKNQVDHLKIKSTGVRFVFRILEQTFRPLYRLPPQFEHFTGRAEELAALREGRDTVKLIAPREQTPQEEKHDKSISQISGTGGIGKSQLANYYARVQFREKNYDWIIWMTGGENDDRALHNLSSQFIDLGNALGLDVEQLKEDVLYQLIYDRLAAKGRGLVVFDDAPNYNVVKSFLPERFGHPEMAVLMTTRNSHTFDSVLTKILLDVFTMKDAKQYIHRLLKETITETDSELLATTLDRYPLALTQALAYILNNQCTIAEYCERYNNLRAAQKKYLETPVHEDDPYQLEHQTRNRKFEATMKVVVELSLEQVKTICQTDEAFGRAKTVLMGATYLAPEVAIPKAILRGWVPSDESEIEINDALDALRALSLIEEDSQLANYRMHQVVQDTLRLNETAEITQERLLQWKKIVKRYLRSSNLSAMMFDEKKYSTLEAHMVVLAQYLSQQPRRDEFLKAQKAMVMSAGIAAKFQGKERTAKLYFEETLNCYRQMSSRKNAEEATCMMNLGSATSACGDPQGAKTLVEGALQILKNTYAEDHLEVGTCMMNLGLATLDCGDTEGAKVYLEKALPILKAKLGEKHGVVSKCLMNLGRIIIACGGDPRIARQYCEDALPLSKATWGEEHATTGACLVQLGLANLFCGEPQTAKGYFAAALPILQNALGERHHHVGTCLTNLGKAMVDCGEQSIAVGHLKKALLILTASLGEKNSTVGVCLQVLGNATLAIGDPRSAIKNLADALRILKASLGDNHADVGRCWMNLGMAAFSCGDLRTAKENLERALVILTARLGAEHSEVGSCLLNLGTIGFACNVPEIAKGYIVRALPILEATLGKGHADVGRGLVTLGAVNLACNDPQTAMRNVEQGLPILGTKLGAGHADVGRAQLYLGMAFLECGDPHTAKRQFEEALGILQTALSKGHPDVGNAWGNLGQAFLSSRDPQKAIKCFQSALQIFKAFFGEEHDNVRNCQAMLDHAIRVAAGNSNRNAVSPITRTDPAGEIRQAAGMGSIDDLQRQLENHLDLANQPDQQPGSRKTALHWAVIEKRPEHVGLLLVFIGYTTVKDGQERSALEYAIQDGNPVIIDHFKTALKNHYSVRTDAQLPLLVGRCVEVGDAAGLKLLIHLKVPVDQADEKTGQTALHLAVLKGDKNLIRLLLEAGADPFYDDIQGATPLSLAEEKDELLAMTILQIVGERPANN